MFRKAIYMVTVAAAALLTSCEKELDFHYHDIDPQLVIEGSLTADGARVVLNNTTPMDEPMDLTPLTDAEVSITDLNTGDIHALEPDEQGIFTNDIPGVAGHDYRLTVLRDGKTYISECKMRPGVEITGLRFEWLDMMGDKMAMLTVEFTDNTATDDYYWVRCYRNGEYYSWTVKNDYVGMNGIVSHTFTTTHQDLKDENDRQALHDGDVMTVTVTPISKDMVDYLSALSNDSNGQPMFNGNQCLGYFLAGAVASSDIVFHPDEIPDHN